MKLQQRFNANHLKLIAIIAMTVDHVCDLVYPGFLVEPMAIGLLLKEVSISYILKFEIRYFILGLVSLYE